MVVVLGSRIYDMPEDVARKIGQQMLDTKPTDYVALKARSDAKMKEVLENERKYGRRGCLIKK